MEISFTEKDLEFRDEIRFWIENEYPKHIKEKQEKGESLTKEEVTEFHKAYGLGIEHEPQANLPKKIIEADASFTLIPGVVCAILTADCLPVFVSKKDGSMVGVAYLTELFISSHSIN